MSTTTTHGPRWQARLDPNGRAHVISEGLATNSAYASGYDDCGKPPRDGRWRYNWGERGPEYNRRLNRPWHATMARALRAAAFHERLRLAGGVV